MQRIFLPTFSKIAELVQYQIKQVDSLNGRGVKVCLLRTFNPYSRWFSSSADWGPISFSVSISKIVFETTLLSNNPLMGTTSRSQY